MAPQVPFWLQMLAVVLAPVLGFAGVSVGAGLKERSDRRLALRQDRRDVYVRFLRALNELDKVLAWDGSAVVRIFSSDYTTRPGCPVDSIRGYRVAIKEHILHATGVAHEIGLVGSMNTDLAANFALARAGELISLATPSHAPDLQDWHERRREFGVAIEFFRYSATRDLLGSKREMERLSGAELSRTFETIREKLASASKSSA